MRYSYGFPIQIVRTLKMPIYTNNSPHPFESRRNHLRDDRAPPQIGGGADKNRGFDNSAVAAKIGKTFSNELLKNSRRDWMFEKSCSTIY